MLETIRRPFAAARALRAALTDPDDTKQVFRLLQTLGSVRSGGFSERFKASRGGQRLLAARPDLFARLSDREALAALPEGSLGRAYLAFMSEGRLDAEFLIQAAEEGGLPHTGADDEAYLGRRMRDAHDLWHVVTGYKGDLLGEASVLAFTFGQTWALGFGLLAGSVFYMGRDPEARRLVADAFARGLRAAWLPAVAWEELLDKPLDEVRLQLRLGPPPVYEPFLSSDLPPGGILAKA
jgi:ubiquinone biosynthesis protein COQ4